MNQSYWVEDSNKTKVFKYSFHLGSLVKIFFLHRTMKMLFEKYLWTVSGFTVTVDHLVELAMSTRSSGTHTV